MSLQEGELTVDDGLAGDNWVARKRIHPDGQITLTNARVVQLYAQERERWPLAGDQLFIDFDLSNAKLAAGDRNGRYKRELIRREKVLYLNGRNYLYLYYASR